MRKKNVKLTTSMLLGFVATIWLTGCAKADVAGSVYQNPNSNQPVQGGQENRTGRGKGGVPGRFRQRTAEETTALLAPLVKDKTITQQQADTVTTFITKQNENRKNTTPEERQAPRGDGQGRPTNGQRPNILGELVKNGTITQEQSDKIAEVLFTPMNRESSASSNSSAN